MKACVDHLGNKYATETEMCKAYGINNPTYKHRRDRGLSLESALTLPVKKMARDKSRAVKDHLGNVYSSKKEMCDAYNIKQDTVRVRLEKGWTLEAALTKPVPDKIIKDHLGNVYSSKKEMCEKYGITPRLFDHRKEKGMSTKDALTQALYTYKCYDHLGNEFETVKDMCKAYNIAYHTYKDRIDKGLSKEQALTMPLDKKQCPISYKGKYYEKLTDLLDEQKITMAQYYTRKQAGWSLEKILETKGNNLFQPFTDCLGNTFKTRKEACEYYRIPKSVVTSRIIQQEKTVEEALYMPYKRHISINLDFDIGDFFMHGNTPYYGCTCTKCGYKGVLGLKEIRDHECK